MPLERHPVGDTAVGHMPLRPLQGDGGDVDTGDLPALLAEPDRVGALAAAEVECATRRNAGDLGDQRNVGSAAPDPVALGVPLVPVIGQRGAVVVVVAHLVMVYERFRGWQHPL